MEQVVYDVWLIGYKEDDTISDIDVCVNQGIDDMQSAIDFASGIISHEDAISVLRDTGLFTDDVLKDFSESTSFFHILVEEAHIDDDDEEYDGYANCVYDEWTERK